MRCARPSPHSGGPALGWFSAIRHILDSLGPTLQLQLSCRTGLPPSPFLVRLILAGWLTVLHVAAGAEDWPQFRGPTGDGHSAAADLPTTWGEVLDPPRWKTPLPGSGWSSPIVVGDRIWVTSAEVTALQTSGIAEKLGEHKYGKEEFRADAHVTFLAVELDATSGKVLRRIDLLEIDNPPPIHVVNSYASPTPASDGARVYCHFGSFGTFCIDAKTGHLIWKQQLMVEDITGPAASPVLCGDHLILVRDGSDQQYVTALHKRTGEVAWKTPRPEIEVAEDKLRRGFSTPLVIEVEGHQQVVSPTAQWVVSYDPATGQELWRARTGDGHAVVPAPVYANGFVFVCSGYHKPVLSAIRVDGRADVTETHIAWTYEKQVPLISSPVVAGQELYFVSAIGIATCLDIRTGEALWQHRLSGNFAASPILADNQIYFTSAEGITTVIRPGREYRELARNLLFGQTLSSIAVFRDALLIRNSSALYCVSNHE